MLRIERLLEVRLPLSGWVQNTQARTRASQVAPIVLLESLQQ